MTDETDDAGAAETMDYDLAQAAQRLRWARQRKFKSAAKARAALHERWGIKRRTYYSHEAGERRPSDEDIMRYAELFGVTPAFLRYGDGADVIEGNLAINEDESNSSVIPINQHRRAVDLKSSHKQPVRFIVILSADQIREVSTGRGGLAQMSGHTLPVPDFLNASPDSFAYVIPSDDLSMVSASGITLPPQSCIVVDPARTILPGELCFADLDDYGPVVRRFVATRAYAPGVPFELHAGNPAYQPIGIKGAPQVLLIGRVIWSGQQH